MGEIVSVHREAVTIAVAMMASSQTKDRINWWINARKERAAEIDRESQRKRLAKARLNPTAFENVRSHWMKHNARRKKERDSSAEFIVMREYRRELSELRRIENLTIHKNPYFRSHVNRKRHERNKVRKIEEPEFRIHMACRRRVNAFVRGKSMRTQDLVGCSWSDYRLWLESKFKAGMSWDNYGEWEIDHIVPCVSFDLTKEDQLYKCFHYSNTQPLWKYENGKKGSRINGAWIRRSGKRLASKESF